MNGCPLFLGRSQEAEVEPSEQYLHMIWEQCMIIMTKKRGEIRPFQLQHITSLFHGSQVCFLLPKCEFFYQCCLINVFISRTYSYEFSKSVLVKKNTPCQGMIYFFYFPNAVMFMLALHWNLINTHLDVFFYHRVASWYLLFCDFVQNHQFNLLCNVRTFKGKKIEYLK